MMNSSFKIKSSILFTILFLIFTSCENQLLPSPTFISSSIDDSTTSSSTWVAPQDLKASNGLKEKISLSWSPVKKAVRYDIYQSTTPFSTFEQIGETNSSTTFDLKVTAGSSYYYKVRAINLNEEATPFSDIVLGSSLAKPIISNIETDKAEGDTTVTVYWWMSNAIAETYLQSLVYLISCMDADNKIIEQNTVYASETTLTQTSFSGLTPNTTYYFTVDAFLDTKQDIIETSEKVNAATARRTRPNPPENLIATEGTNTDSVILTFTLPDFVDISLGNNTFEQKPLYFKVSRRIHSDTEENSFVEINGSLKPDSYIVGETLSWTDTSVIRGQKYDYKVQSYADVSNRIISSDLSVATTTGWALAIPSFYVSSNNPVLNTESTAYISDSINFSLNWETFGKDENFSLNIFETKTDTEIDGSTVHEATQINTQPLSIEELSTFKRDFDLSGTEVAIKDVRGYYSYTLQIINIDDSTEIATVNANRRVLITDSTVLPEIKNFSYKDGYKDKFIISWTYDNSCEYKLSYLEATKSGNSWIIDTDPKTVDLTQAISETNNNSIITINDIAESGDARIYTLTATQGVSVDVTTGDTPLQTLGIPNMTKQSATYNSFTVSFPPVQKASSYEICFTYEYDTNTLPTDKSDLSGILNTSSVNASDITETLTNDWQIKNGIITYTFTNPSGYNDALIAGRNMQIILKANNIVDGQTISSEQTLDNVSLIGPALTNISATKATSQTQIIVSWSIVNDISGYLIKRERCSLDNSEVLSTDVYYVSSDCSDIKNGLEQADSNSVSATISGSQIILTDKYTSLPTTGATTYQSNQDKITWGFPYRYTVVPVISDSDTFDKITLENLDKIYDIGSTLGYGHNVNATKAADPYKITITWDKPYMPSTLNIEPVLWKTISGTNEWEKSNTSLDSSGNKFVFIPKDNERTEAYDFAIQYSSSSTKPNQTYLDALAASATDDEFNESTNKGYAFAIACKAENVTTDGVANFSEKISWTPWDFTTRKRGPRTGEIYTIQLQNPDYTSTEWQTVATATLDDVITIANNDAYNLNIQQSGISIILTPTDLQEADSIHSGLLSVLTNYKHYVNILINRDTDDGEITASVTNMNEDLYMYRQISAGEFARCSALTIGESLYNDNYCSSSASSYVWTFEFNGTGPYFMGTTGTMTSSRYILLTGKPHTHGATASLFGGTSSNKATLQITGPNINLYSGTVVIDMLCKESGTYSCTYNENTVDYSAGSKSYIPFN